MTRQEHTHQEIENAARALVTARRNGDPLYAAAVSRWQAALASTSGVGGDRVAGPALSVTTGDQDAVLLPRAA
jgi:hypothetical protein